MSNEPGRLAAIRGYRPSGNPVGSSTALNEQLFQAIFMAMDEGAILKNRNGEIIAVNPAAENMFGLAAADLIGRSSAEFAQALNFVHEDGTPIPWERHPTALALQTASPQHHVVMGAHRPDGTLVWLSANTRPLLADDGAGPYAVVNTFRNITAHKLTKSYERFRGQTLELLSGGASLQDVLNSIVLSVEQLSPGAICSILLLDRQGQHLGESVAPSLPDFYKAAIDGIEIGIGVGSCGTAAATGERVIVDDIRTHPYWAPYKDLAASAGLGACWSEPIRSSSGQVLGTFAIYHCEVYSPTEFDLSIVEKSVHLASLAIERKRSEDALRASEERMRLFFERQLVGMAITSPEKSWIQVNDNICEMLGYSREELTQLTWAKLTYPDDLAPDVAQFERLLNGEIDNYTLEKRFVRKDGGIVFTNLAVSCVRLADGSVDYVLALLDDISERKRMENEIRRREREYRTLVENSPDPIFRYDRDFRRLFVHTAKHRKSTQPLESMIGSSPTDGRVLASDEARKLMAGIRQVFDSGAPACVDLDYVDRDGKHRDYQMLLVPEQDENGAPTTVLGLAHEITAIRDAERRMTEFVANLPGFAYTFHLSPEGHGSFPFASPGIEKLVGLTAADVKDDMAPLLALAHPDDIPRIISAMEESARTMMPYQVETRICRPGLPVRWIELRSVPLRQADDSVLWHGIMLDIDERKRIEAELNSHVRVLETMDRVNRAIQGSTDLEQIMNDVLEVVLADFGCDRAFLLYPCDPDAAEWRVPMERTRPEYPGCRSTGRAVPMDADAARLLRLLLDAKGPVKFGHETGYPIHPIASKQFGVKSQILMAIFPRVGKPWQFGIHQCSHARNWTHDEEALFEQIGWRLSDALTGLLMYRRLQASEQEFRTLAENLPDNLVRYDHEGRRTYINPALEQYAAIKAEQMIGMTLRETNPTKMSPRETYQRALEHTLATGERSEFEMQVVTPGNDLHTHLCFIAAERTADGYISGAIAVSRNITDLKRNETELDRHRHHLEKLVEERTLALSRAKETAEAATRAKTRFLASASHDLRQPLQAIRLFNAALTRTGLDETQKNICGHVATSVNSLGELLNKLLDISRLDAGAIKPQFRAIPAEDLLSMVAAEFDVVVGEKNLRLNLFCPRQGLVLFGDDNLLRTVLRNLVGNAVKYTARGGIMVAVRRRGSRALLQVWDTGIGIAPEQKDAIFEEYVQVGNPERDRAKGVGLGLSIVKRLSKLLDLGVYVRSREGKGSVFGFTVPLADASDAPAWPQPVSAMPEDVAVNRLPGKRFVIVEDDEMAAQAVKLALELEGARVAIFGTAESALESAEAIGADYYISDYRLPGMNGLQLLDGIQRRSASPITAVLLTGETSPDHVELARASGWPVVFKPTDMATLLSALAPD